MTAIPGKIKVVGALVAAVGLPPLATPSQAAPQQGAVPGDDIVTSKTVYVSRTQAVTATFVHVEIASPSRQDPGRCVSFGFAQWPRVRYATRYTVVMKPPPEYADRTSPMTITQTDDAPFKSDRPGVGGGDEVEIRNAAPPTSYATSVGTITWPDNVARANLNSFSGPDGCSAAVARLAVWTHVSGTAQLSVPIRTIKRRHKLPAADKAPKGAVMRVTEVNGALYRKGPDGKRHKLHYKDWVFPGDVLYTEGRGTTASIEMITGGRIGIAADRAVWVMNEGQVKDVTQEGPLTKPVLKSQRLWDKISKRKAPLEVETAGGVMGSKG